MKILNYGSLNIDVVFQVESIVRPGETIASSAVARHPGGKGLNQNIALARAGAVTYHGGLIGNDGLWLRELLEDNGVDCRHLHTVDTPTGSAFIQVERGGQNSIVLFGGANQKNSPELCDSALSELSAGDMLLIQNEVNCMDYLIRAAHEKAVSIVLNPSPMNEIITSCDLSLVDWFILNETEGLSIAGCSCIEDILPRLHELFPNAGIVLTLGEDGSEALYKGRRYRQAAFKTKAVDTTAAGDTFTGYFLACISQGREVDEALLTASKAAAISVSREGAASSIPRLDEVI